MSGKKENLGETTDCLDFVDKQSTPPSNNQSGDGLSLKSTEENAEITEDVELGHRSTYIASGAAAGLSQEHRDYLLAKHGTLDLDPIPDMGDQDPLNWPTWKKVVNMCLVATHAMTGILISAAIIPAYQAIADDLGVGLQQASYLSALMIAIMGGAPLLWKPISNRYGRRPIWFVSFACSCAFNIGCALSNSFEVMAVCRAFVAFFICPASAIGTGVVTETFFKTERGKYIGIWTVLVTLGTPLGPLVCGFITYHAGWRWVYWFLAMFNGAQLVLAIFFQPETRYLRVGVKHYGSAFRQEYLQFRRIDPKPFTFYEFIQPLSLFKYPSVTIPAVAYAMVFLFCSVMLSIEIPDLFLDKFGLNAQQLGLQFIGIIVGTVIGEQLGGAMSDWWMNHKTKADSSRPRPEPEYRLWLSYGGYALTICGCVVFLVQTAHAADGQWNVTPNVGMAIASAGLQIITTVLITYAIDCHPEESNSIGVYVNFVRQMWSFIGPFWLPDLFSSVGTAASSGVVVALVVGVSLIPTMVLQYCGARWRNNKAERALSGEK